MRSHFKLHKRAFLFPLAAWLAMVIMLLSLPIAFCGYESGDRDTIFWYYLSESGGVIGTTVLVTVLCLFFASLRSGWKRKTRSFAASFGFFALVLGGIAFTNENALKPLLRKPRPSHQFLLQSGGSETSLLPEYYQNEVVERRAYLRQFIQQNPGKVKAISPQVLNHWVEEAGYSFPSGHSQNAFLLATILVFWLWGVLPRRKHYWLALPVSWAMMVCLSRVALGVHTEVDVAFGSAFGLIFAYVFSFTGLLNRLYGTLPNHINNN